MIIDRTYVLSAFSHLLLVVNSSANIVVYCWKVRDRFTPERKGRECFTYDPNGDIQHYPALPHIKNTLSSFNTHLLQGREIPRCLPGNSGLSESISYFRLSSGEIRFFLRKVHASTLYSSVANDNSVLLFVYLCVCVFVYLTHDNILFDNLEPCF